MKSLTNYIVENEADGKNGHYEKFYDEDTGETIVYWANDPTPEEIKNQIKKDDYTDNFSKEQQERKRLNLDELEDNVWDLQSQLKNLHKNFISIQYDQEDEIGNAKTDEEKDNIAQKYGEKLDQVSKKQQDIKKKLAVAQNNLNKAEKEFANFRDKLWDI